MLALLVGMGSSKSSEFRTSYDTILFMTSFRLHKPPTTHNTSNFPQIGDALSIEYATSDDMSYLILGDGDFTFSLDLCRYFSLRESKELKSIPSPLIIVCTGIDTLEELRYKYKDIDFTLREIRSLSKDDTTCDVSIMHDSLGNSQMMDTDKACSVKRARTEGLKTKAEVKTNEIPFPTSHPLHITIHHGVNAIQPWNEPSQDIYDSDNLLAFIQNHLFLNANLTILYLTILTSEQRMQLSTLFFYVIFFIRVSSLG